MVLQYFMMMRRILVWILISLMVISCKRDSPYARLSGSVYYYGIAIPISDVRVKVDQNITFSGAEGEYELTDIRKGTYVIRADKEGFETYNFEMKFYDDIIYHNINMLSEELTSTVYGFIYGDYSGESRQGLRCVVMNPNGTESRLESVSDSLGFYEVKLVPKGIHLFKVINDDEVVHQEWLEVGENDLEYDIALPDVFTFEDKRDGREYKALKIGSLTWMTENLAYLPYVNEPENVSANDRLYYVYGYDGRDPAGAVTLDSYEKYGVLYNYKAAITACPEGWRLPTDEEWKGLEIHLGMDGFEAGLDSWRNSGDVGIALKDSTGWLAGGEGTNSSWFNGLPGGYVGYNGGFYGEGFFAGFWSETKCGAEFAWHRYLKAGEDGVFRLCNYMRHGYSVRCVK